MSNLTTYSVVAKQAESLKSIICFGEDNEMLSDWAACLMPLLEAMNWRGASRHIAEAIPHFATNLDLVDFRNIFAHLGFTSHSVRIKAFDIDESLYPCLFVTQNEEVCVLLRKEGDHLIAYSGRARKEVALESKRLKGTAYFFETVKAEKTKEKRESNNWFLENIRRFKKIVYQLFFVTFISNILSLSIPLFILLIYDKVIGNRSSHTLIYLAIGVIAVIGCEFILRLLRSHAMSYIGGRVDYIFGTKSFNKVLSLPIGMTERASVGGQLSRLREFESIRDFFVTPLSTVLLDLPFVVVFILVIGLLAGDMALIPILMCLVFCVLGIILIPKFKIKIDEASEKKIKKQNFLIETLSNLRSIKNIAGEKIWFDRFRELSADASMASYEMSKFSNFIQTISQSLMMLTGVLFLVVGTNRVIAGDLGIGALIATMALGWRVLSPIQVCFTSYTRIEQFVLAIKQLNNLMKFKSEYEPETRSYQRQVFNGHVGFKRVSIRYSPQSEPALIGVSFAVNPGENIAIVGSNGSGKSTLLKLIMGLYNPQGGVVQIDGIDVRQIYPEELRSSIGYVPQYNHHFYGTIAQNIKFGDPTASDSDLYWTAKTAGIFDDIMSLPDGFETRITDNALNQFSTGFFRRLALARVYLRKPAILVLDEAANNLDFEADEVFMETLKKFKGHTTVIQATHRPSHIKLADKAIYLNKGQIEFIGTPEEVLQNIPGGMR